MVKRICRLTRDVTNPIPDSRSNVYDRLPVWKAGTRVEVLDPNPTTGVGRVFWPDNSYVLYCLTGGDHFHRQGNEVVECLEEVRDLGAVLKIAESEGEDVLIWLVEHGKVTLEDVEQAAREEQEMDENAWFEFRRRNGM